MTLSGKHAGVPEVARPLGKAHWGILAAIAAVYFIAGKLGLQLASVHESATAIWPPTGIALAAFLLLGSKIWPGIFAGAFLVNLTTTGSVLACSGIATGNTLEGLVGALLVRRYAGGAQVFDHPTNVFRFTLLAGMVATAISATFGTASLVLDRSAAPAAAPGIWLTWWLGDLSGALVVAPLILQWSVARRERWTLEVPALLILLVVVTQVIFGSWTLRAYSLGFLCVPFLVWSALRLDQRATATLLIALAIVANGNTLLGLGPFASTSPHESLLLLQGYLGVLSLMSLAMGATVAERRRAREALQTTNDELERHVADRTAELRAANEKLHASEARLIEAKEIARLGSWEWNLIENRVDASDRCLALFGLRAREFNGTFDALIEHVHPDDRPVFTRMLNQTREGGGNRSCEHRVTFPDGSVRVVHTTAHAAVEADGRVIRMAGTCQDITERRHAEEERARLVAQLLQSQKLQALGQLTAGIAHEINNPIAFILSNLHILAARSGEMERLLKASRQAVEEAARGRAVPAREELIRIARELESDLLIDDFVSATADCQKGAARIRDIVSSLQQFSHPDVSEWRRTNLQELLENALRLCSNELKHKADVKKEIAPVPPVLCYGRQIEQVFVNLLLNAAQAIRDHGEISVGLQLDADDAVVRVRDTGCGIPATHLGKLFEPFFTTKPVGKGTGLGLHLAYKIVSAHGGRIEVSSSTDQGTVFTIRLPVNGPPATSET